MRCVRLNCVLCWALALSALATCGERARTAQLPDALPDQLALDISRLPTNRDNCAVRYHVMMQLGQLVHAGLGESKLEQALPFQRAQEIRQKLDAQEEVAAPHSNSPTDRTEMAQLDAANADRIQPWRNNPRYWQYKGKPVMLLGGSKDDNLFQIPDLKEHLDEMAAVGANYIRNTMSDRNDKGFEMYPFRQRPDGKYDLEQWNDEYWQRFQNMLKWTAERDIIVQIEVWDRFDYADGTGPGNWQTSPWNPKNNVNYTYAESGFAEKYVATQLYRDEHPFFHTVPGTHRYASRYDLIRKHQERFVNRMLEFSLPYGNVLYCMNNETSTPAAWGQYWIKFIQAAAKRQGVIVYTTDMFDDAYQAEQAKLAPIVFKDAEHYMFADISQVNSRNYDQLHWDRLQWLLKQVNEQHPRPSNHTKIYGGGYSGFGTGGPEDGIERFWRNILGGSAAARFHRPNSGNGLNERAKASIQAARLLEQRIKFWDISPHMELLSDREPNEAYLAAKPGESYALYFTSGGSVNLDLSRAPGTFKISWISVSEGRVVENSQANGYQRHDKTIEGGRAVTLAAPFKGGWVAALVKQD